jgi:hypothetical protein
MYSKTVLQYACQREIVYILSEERAVETLAHGPFVGIAIPHFPVSLQRLASQKEEKLRDVKERWPILVLLAVKEREGANQTKGKRA